MPPKKKRAKKAPTQKQKQTQRQSVVVNIGKASAKKKASTRGTGTLPPPSYQHNLAPTFVTSQQVDYTPLLMAVLQSGKVQDPVPIRNPVTPLSATTQSSAQQMAGIKAEERRAGPTAANLQPHPSQADARLAQDVQAEFDVIDMNTFQEKVRQKKQIREREPRPPPGTILNPATGRYIQATAANKKRLANLQSGAGAIVTPGSTPAGSPRPSLFENLPGQGEEK